MQAPHPKYMSGENGTFQKFAGLFATAENNKIPLVNPIPVKSNTSVYGQTGQERSSSTSAVAIFP